MEVIQIVPFFSIRGIRLSSWIIWVYEKYMIEPKIDKATTIDSRIANGLGKWYFSRNLDIGNSKNERRPAMINGMNMSFKIYKA
jgi:hypothetical protein